MKRRWTSRFPRRPCYVDDDMDEERDDSVSFAFAMAQKGRRIRRARQRGKSYLTRADLLQNPRSCSPWEAMYRARNDGAYIATTGLDVAGFERLLQFFVPVWNVAAIPRGDVAITGKSCPDRHSLGPAALGLVLHYLNSSIKETTLQQIFAITPAVASRYLHFSLRIFSRASATDAGWKDREAEQRYCV